MLAEQHSASSWISSGFHAEPARSLTRCSSTTSCAGSAHGTVAAPWLVTDPLFEPTRACNIPPHAGDRKAKKRPTPEPACDGAAKRIKDATTDAAAPDDAPHGSLDSSYEVFELGAEARPSLATEEELLLHADEDHCGRSLAQRTSSGSSGCHFELPGLLNDFVGCGDAALEFMALASPGPSVVKTASVPQPALTVPQQQQPGIALVPAPAVDPVFRTQAGLRDVLRNLCKTERSMPPVGNYMASLATFPPGEYVDRHMRRVAVSWLVEVAGEFRLHQETLFLSVALLDRFLSTQAIERRILQLVCTTCMFLAAKHEEELVPSVAEFTSIADNCFTKEDLLRMEGVVLDALGFRLNVPTAHEFLQLYLQGCGPVQKRTRALTAYALELTLLDYTFVRHPPSVVAAAVLLYASLHQGEPHVSERLRSLTGMPQLVLQPVAVDLMALHGHACGAHEEADPVGPVKDKHRQAAGMLPLQHTQGGRTPMPLGTDAAC